MKLTNIIYDDKFEMKKKANMEDDWLNSPEYKEAYDKFRNLGNIFEHSKEFANARNAYRKRINK